LASGLTEDVTWFKTHTHTHTQIFHNILEHRIQWPAVPQEMSEAAQDLITRLLSQDPTQRLGFDGAQGVKQHPFFAGVDWATLPLQVSRGKIRRTTFVDAKQGRKNSLGEFTAE
jgi:serine/threonine protein kinase